MTASMIYIRFKSQDYVEKRIVIKSIDSHWFVQVITSVSMPHEIWDAYGTQLGLARGLESKAYLILVY